MGTPDAIAVKMGPLPLSETLNFSLSEGAVIRLIDTVYYRAPENSQRAAHNQF